MKNRMREFRTSGSVSLNPAVEIIRASQALELTSEIAVFHQLRSSWAIFLRIKGLRFNCQI